MTPLEHATMMARGCLNNFCSDFGIDYTVNGDRLEREARKITVHVVCTYLEMLRQESMQAIVEIARK